MAKVLAYNMPDEIVGFLKTLSKEHDFKIILTDDSYLSTKIEDILAGKRKEKTKEEGVDINFLMLDGFDNEALNKLLLDMKKNKVYIPNKCVSTPHNLGWTLKKLLLENKEEHETMSIYKGLSFLRAEAMEYLAKNEDKKMQESVDTITEYMQKREFDKDELMEFYKELEALLREKK